MNGKKGVVSNQTKTIDKTWKVMARAKNNESGRTFPSIIQSQDEMIFLLGNFVCTFQLSERKVEEIFLSILSDFYCKSSFRTCDVLHNH